MFTLKSVLPNFAKTMVFLATAILSINAFAATNEEGETAGMEKADAMTDQAHEASSDTMGTVTDTAGDVKAEAADMVDDAGEKIPDLKDMASD